MGQEIATRIEAWIREREGKRVFPGRLKRADLLRLTRLRVWSWQYKVEIEEILSLTLPYLRKSTVGQMKSRYGLGCTIAALTGTGNEKILVEALRLKYPGGEHRDIWRDAQRAAQLAAEEYEDNDGLVPHSRRVKGLLESDSTADFLSSYRRRVLAARSRNAAELGSARRRRKKYYLNPWL